jgi:hypothetical protein
MLSWASSTGYWNVELGFFFQPLTIHHPSTNISWQNQQHTTTTHCCGWQSLILGGYKPAEAIIRLNP